MPPIVSKHSWNGASWSRGRISDSPTYPRLSKLNKSSEPPQSVCQDSYQ